MRTLGMDAIQAARGVVYSDLDGTLVDSKTFEPGPGVEAMIEELAGSRVLVIPVTSKTAAEVMRLGDRLPLAPLAIVEGGAVLMIGGKDPELAGPGRSSLVEKLEQLQREGWPITGVSQMDVDTVCQVSGLDRTGALRAMDRLGSEPFVINEGEHVDAAALSLRIKELGATTVRGDRFWHLLGAGIGKGTAVGKLEDQFPGLKTIPRAGIGDAWNDVPMLCWVDHGFLLGSLVADEEIPCSLTRIPEMGPPGFIQAVTRFRQRVGV